MVVFAALLLSLSCLPGRAEDRLHDRNEGIRHVPLISIDGLHALDVARLM